VAELVVPLVRDQRRPAQLARGGSQPGPGHYRGAGAQVMPRWPDTDRLRPPGSDWLYLTLTGPRATEDTLLAGSLGALADRLVGHGDADGWLFVRYGDPEPHLRLRIHGDSAALMDRALPALARWGAQAIAEGSRTRLTVETYERELERYGGPVTTGLCERIACTDSRTVRFLLAVSPAPSQAAQPATLDPADRSVPCAPRDRLELALMSTADLLASFGGRSAHPTLPSTEATGIGVRSGAVYRARQSHLRTLIAALQDGRAAPGADHRHPAQVRLQSVLDVLADRRVKLTPLVAQLNDRCRDGTGLVPAAQLVPSLMHMHVNRLGLSRADEQLMLGLLGRTLRSLRAYPVSRP
jgi:thiopeptide-type bacteriocin biosynthesis protein